VVSQQTPDGQDGWTTKKDYFTDRRYVVVGSLKGKKLLGRPRSVRQNNIKKSFNKYTGKCGLNICGAR
jgi:hypothetical protein